MGSQLRRYIKKNNLFSYNKPEAVAMNVYNFYFTVFP